RARPRALPGGAVERGFLPARIRAPAGGGARVLLRRTPARVAGARGARALGLEGRAGSDPTHAAEAAGGFALGLLRGPAARTDRWRQRRGAGRLPAGRRQAGVPWLPRGRPHRCAVHAVPDEAMEL